MQPESKSSGFFTPETNFRVWIDDGELKTKKQDRQRVLVLVVCCGAIPAVLWCDASARGSVVARLLHAQS